MHLADALSRLSSLKQRCEILLDVHVYHIAFSNRRLVHLQEETKSYVGHVHKLTSDDGLLLKHSKMIMPLALTEIPALPSWKTCRHHKVPTDSYNLSTHPVSTMTMTNSAPIALGYHLHLPTEHLINHDIPQRKLSSDLMDWNSIHILLLINYFSNYPFLFQMSSTTMYAVRNHVTELFILKRNPARNVDQ